MSERTLFLAALDIEDPAQRAEFLATACGGDDGQRGRIESLLLAHRQAGRFLNPPAGALEEIASTPSEGLHQTLLESLSDVGTVLGHYRLLHPLGEGGMGVVYLAEQQEPVRRQVALKLIKPGMDSRQIVARFEAERQTLALMDHPNIAKVLDGGTTPRGRPYFVMELVQGVTITNYCDEHCPGVRGRLELFIEVCEAVQHAHQKGIIHRDLKPTNVLVALRDGQPVPKVIDFGVAKALGQSLADDSLHTHVGQVIGTLEYMAPEQAQLNAADIDTRSDIYALGVLLYNLLTGTTPFDGRRLRGMPYVEALRIVREEEPPRPSHRPKATSRRESDLPPWQELDWIVMKALEKDRTRRYTTANDLASDLKRYLHDEPVMAGPPSASYWVRKFVRRHRGWVATAATFVALLLLGVVGLVVGLVLLNAERGRKVAALEAERIARRRTYEALEALTDKVVEQHFAMQPQLGQSEKAFLRKVLAFYEEFTHDQGDAAEAQFFHGYGYFRVGRVRSVLGERKEAENAYRAALSILTPLAADDPVKPLYRQALALCHANLGDQLIDTGRLQEAETSNRQSVELFARLAEEFPDNAEYRSGGVHANRNVGRVLQRVGRDREAEAAYREALRLVTRLAADSPDDSHLRSDLVSIHHGLGALLGRTASLQETEAAYREALSMCRQLVADSPGTAYYQRQLASAHVHLGTLLADTGRAWEAESAFREAIDLRLRLATTFPSAPRYREELATGKENLATLLTQTGRAKEAEPVLQEALVTWRKLVAESPDVPESRQRLAAAHFGLGNVFEATGRAKEAETAYREAIQVQTRLVNDFTDVPARRQELSRTYNNLGILLGHAERKAEAETAYREALALDERLAAEFPTIADYGVSLARTCCNLGNLFQFTGQAAKALGWYDRAITTLGVVLVKVPQQTKPRQFLRNAHWGRADTLGKLNRQRDAISDWDRAVELSPQQQRPPVLAGRARSLALAGEPTKATEAAEELLAAPNLSGSLLYDLACVFALSAAGTKDEAQQREQYGVRAVQLLGRAQALGYFKPPGRVEHLKNDDDLAIVRQREDYRKWLAGIEK